MAMSVNSATSGGSSVSSTSGWQKSQQDFQSLSKALQSGNLDSAKAAYAQLVKDSPASATQDPNSPLSQIGKALQSGSIAAAQKAMSTMKGGHGHHHRAASTTTASSTTPTVSNATTTLGNNVNVLV